MALFLSPNLHKRAFRIYLLYLDFSVFMGIKQICKQNFSKCKNLIKKNINNVPIKIRFVSVSVFLFMIGWGLGTDTYFSIYVRDIIGNGW